MTAIVTSVNNQSIYDLMAQCIGGYNSMVDFCVNNGVGDVNAVGTSAQIFNYDTDKIENQNNINRVYATGIQGYSNSDGRGFDTGFSDGFS